MRFTHKTITKPSITPQEILAKPDKRNKEVEANLSIRFWNPFGGIWDTEILCQRTEIQSNIGVKILSLSDTVGSATPQVIIYSFLHIILKYPFIEVFAHLNTAPDKWLEKIDFGHNSDCLHFAVHSTGFGGFPTPMMS